MNGIDPGLAERKLRASVFNILLAWDLSVSFEPSSGKFLSIAKRRFCPQKPRHFAGVFFPLDFPDKT